MKAKIILGLLVAGLIANGSSCLNDPFIVPLNADLTDCEISNAGGRWGPPDDQPVTIRILDKIPEPYRDNVVGARLVDVVIYAVNPDTSARVNGTAGLVLGGTMLPVVSFDGTGAQFAERRSLLKDQAPLIVANSAGLDSLESIINRFIRDPENTYVTIYSQGAVSPPVTGQEVCVEILVQVDGEVSVD